MLTLIAPECCIPAAVTVCALSTDGKLNPSRQIAHWRWNSVENEPKTRRSAAPIPVVKQLADAVNAHKLRDGKLAQPNLSIFQAGNGKPLNRDNLARRVIIQALCRLCDLLEARRGAQAGSASI